MHTYLLLRPDKVTLACSLITDTACYSRNPDGLMVPISMLMGIVNALY